jgi:hypothetical protein
MKERLPLVIVAVAIVIIIVNIDYFLVGHWKRGIRHDVVAVADGETARRPLWLLLLWLLLLSCWYWCSCKADNEASTTQGALLLST